MSSPRPHDLVRFGGKGRDLIAPDAPRWVRRSGLGTGWAVVRRAQSPPGTLPVGLRGQDRSQRYACTLDLVDVDQVIAPEDLVGGVDAARRDAPALAELPTCRDRLADLGVTWGPTGSVGFELATGTRVVTASSDLDVIVRASQRIQLWWATRLNVVLDSLAVRVDCQIDTPAGAVALSEVLGDAPDVLLRTPVGPRLASRSDVLE